MSTKLTDINNPEEEPCLTKDAETFEITKSAFNDDEFHPITIGYTNSGEKQTEMKVFLSPVIRDKYGNQVRSLCIQNALSSTWMVDIKNHSNNILIPPKALVKDVVIITVDTVFPDEKLTYNIKFKECTADEIEQQVEPSNLEWARHIWINMYTSTEHRDTLIRCSNGEMSLHRFALAAASPVLQAAFTHGAESCNGVLNVPDMDKETLEVIVRYIYCGITKVNSELCEKVMAAADKYDLPRLKSAAEAKMCKLACEDNVLHYYKLAELYLLKDLKKKCLKVIVTADAQSFETVEDLMLLRDTVTMVQQRRMLVTPELQP